MYWDGTGVWVLAKRHEQGRFSWAAATDERAKIALAPEAMAMLISGVDLKQGTLKLWYERWFEKCFDWWNMRTALVS